LQSSSPHERSDMRDPGCRFAHPGYAVQLGNREPAFMDRSFEAFARIVAGSRNRNLTFRRLGSLAIAALNARLTVLPGPTCFVSS
jgi:hypothetical protein